MLRGTVHRVTTIAVFSHRPCRKESVTSWRTSARSTMWVWGGSNLRQNNRIRGDAQHDTLRRIFDFTRGKTRSDLQTE